MLKTKIAHAVSLTLVGATLAIATGTASADVSYNSASQVNGNSTNGAGTWTNGAATTYSGKLPVDWMATFVSNTDSFTISTANAQAAGAPGTYNLSVLGHRWNPASSWGNALDFGLIDLQANSNLTVRVQGDTGFESFLPGFTLWNSWDNTTTSSKHGSWNANPFAPGNRNATNLTYHGHAATNSSDGGVNYSYANGAVEITFENLAAGQYSLWIGGNGTVTSSFNYVASVSASPVPIPGAVWLFGSAIAGMVGFARRKSS